MEDNTLFNLKRNPEKENNNRGWAAYHPPTHAVLDGRARKLRPMTMPELVRFMHKVKLKRGSTCWYWTGYCHKHGYGHWSQGGESYWTYRLTYRHFKGVIPKGLIVDHMCENKNCCNPDHLKIVTLSQNGLLHYWRKRNKYNLLLPFNKGELS